MSVLCYLPRAGFPDFYRVNLCSGLLTTINIQQDIIYMPLFSARTAEMLFWLCFFPAIPTQNLVLVLNLLIFISPQRCDVTPIKLCSTRLLTRFLKSLNFFCFTLAYQTFFLKSNFYYFGKQTLFLCFWISRSWFIFGVLVLFASAWLFLWNLFIHKNKWTRIQVHSSLTRECKINLENIAQSW